MSYIVPSVPLALFMDKWKQESGADLVRVPFRGGGEAVTSVLSGATPVAFFGLANWTQNIRAGTVRPLAVDGETRSPVLPDVPTLRELGYRGSITRVYFGIVAPAGTPKPIIQKLRDEMARIGSEPEFRQRRLIDAGLEPVFDTPEEFARFLKENRARPRASSRRRGWSRNRPQPITCFRCADRHGACPQKKYCSVGTLFRRLR